MSKRRKCLTSVASPGTGHWGTCPLEFDARKILQPFFVSTYRPITHIKALIAVTVRRAVAKNFSHIRFCRPNARWLSRLDDFVTTNFGIEVCMGMGKTGIPWVPWDSHGNGCKISHGMGMG